MPKQPLAPREKLTPCRICGKPDYLEGLCYRHWRIEKLGLETKADFYSERQQDQDKAANETKDCGCARLPESYHGWDCALNTMAEVGEEHIFDPSPASGV